MNQPSPRARVGQRYLTTALPLLAFALSAIGILLILEVIRPFHDLTIDGPLALVLWGIGALLGLLCFFLRGRSLVLCVLGLGLNVLPLIAAAILWWLLSHSNFAWLERARPSWLEQACRQEDGRLAYFSMAHFSTAPV